MTEYRIYRRIERPFYNEYRLGDRLWLDPAEYSIPVRAGPLVEAIRAAYPVTDPRAVQVGDIVVTDFGTIHATFEAVETEGFRKVAPIYAGQVVNSGLPALGTDATYEEAVDRVLGPWSLVLA
jgi:hypothetical protein